MLKIDKDLIFLNLNFDSCEECVSFIGEQMVKAGIATEQYTQAMLKVVSDYKGIIVLEDGFALAHARPEEGVLKDGLVFVQLAKALDFYNPDFEQVKLVVGMAATGSAEHITTLKQLVTLIEEDIQHQDFQSKEQLLSFINKVIERR